MSAAANGESSFRRPFRNADSLATKVNINAGFSERTNASPSPLHNTGLPPVRASFTNVWKKPCDFGSPWFTFATTSTGVVKMRLNCWASMLTTRDTTVLSWAVVLSACSLAVAVCTRIVCHMKKPTFE
eukprot:1517385-Amphidinium_carterae.1